MPPRTIGLVTDGARDETPTSRRDLVVCPPKERNVRRNLQVTLRCCDPRQPLRYLDVPGGWRLAGPRPR